MELFHRTWAIRARDILDNGFDEALEVIWLQEQPDFSKEIKGGDAGDMMLALDVPDAVIAQALIDKPLKGIKRYRIAPSF